MKLLNTVGFICFFLVLQAPFLFSQNKDSLWNAYRHENNDTSKILQFIELGNAYINSNSDSALVCFQKALQISYTTKYTKFTANSLNTIGKYYTMQGFYDSALVYFKKWQKLEEDLQNMAGASDAYYNIAYVYLLKASYNNGLEYLFKAVKIKESLNDKKKLAPCYMNIGNVYFFQNNYPKALEYYTKSLQLNNELGIKKGASTIYNNLACIYIEQNNLERAFELCLQSIQICEEINDQKGLALAYANLGVIYSEKKEFQVALKYYQKSFDIDLLINNKMGLSIDYNNFANLYLKQKKYNLVIEYSQKSFEIAKNIGALQQQKAACENLMLAYSGLKIFEKAFNYSVLHKSLHDSIYTLESNKQMEEMQSKYDSDNQIKEIELLNKDKKIQQTDNAKLKVIILASLLGIILLIIFSFVLSNRLAINRSRKLTIENQHKKLLSQTEKLEQYKNQLEELVDERTQNLTLAKETAEESEKKYRQIFENSTDLIFIIDVTKDLRFIMIGYNPVEANFFRTFFKSDNNFENQYVDELLPPEISTKVIPNYVQCVQHKKIIQYEEELDTSIGKAYFYTQLIPITNSEGKVYRILGIAKDITESKKINLELLLAKEKAEESEQKYRLIAENTSDGILVIDAKTSIHYASPSFLKMQGFNQDDEFLGDSKTIYSLVHPDDRDSLFTTIFEAIQQKKIELVYTFRAKYSDGSYYWREDHAKFNYNSNGNHIGTYVICRNITERKNAEIELINNLSQFNAIFNNAYLSYIIINKSMHIIDFNEVAKKTGELLYQRTMKHGESIYNYVREVDKFNFEAQIQSALAGNIVFSEKSYDISIMQKTWFLFEYIPIANHLGEFDKVCEIAHNISDWKNAQIKAQENEAIYRLLAENSSDVVWLMDLDFNFKYISPSAEKLFGYSIDELKSFLTNSLFNPEKYNYLKAIMSEKAKEFEQTNKSETVFFEMEHFHKSGKIVDIDISAVFVLDENRKIIGIQGTSRDISVRKKAEREINKLHKAIESAKTSIIITDFEGKIEYANPHFTHVTGFLPDEYKGKNPNFLKSDFSGSNFYKNIWETIRLGQTWEGEFYNQKKNGESYWEYAIISPVRDERGKTFNYVAIVDDITQQKEMDKKMLQAIIEAEEKERVRIAQELHDGVSPLISSSKMFVQAFDNPNSKMDKHELAINIEELLVEAQKIVRQISFNLSPHILQNFGLVEAVKALAEKIESGGNILIHVATNDMKRISPNFETILYRLLSECMNNTIKHANASQIDINFQFIDNGLKIMYSDNGSGFDYNQAIHQKNGIGLFNMKNRIEIMNGSFDIQTGVGLGTKIYIAVNLT